MNVKTLASEYCPAFLRLNLNKIRNSQIGYRLARGVFWSMAGAVISRGLMFAAWVFVARILNKTGYGELGMIQSTIGMFGVIAGFGLGLTSTKYVAEFRSTDPVRAGQIIGFSGLVAMVTGGLMAVGLFFFAPWLAEHSIKAPHLAGVLRIGALILFVNSLNGAQTGALSGFEAFKTIACVNLFISLVSFPLLVGGAYLGGLTGAVWALGINLCFNWLLNHLALNKEARRYKVPITFRKCRNELSILWRFSLPAVLGAAMIGPIVWVCNAMLVNKPGGYEEMGIFTATIIFQNLLLFAAGMLDAPLLSIVANAGSNVSERLSTVNILSTWILGVVFAVPLLCFPEVAQLVFGSDYYTHHFQIAFSLVVFCTSIMAYKAGLTRIIVANNILWWGFFSNALWGIILIVSTLFLIHLGAPGLAASFVIAYMSQTLILFPLYYSRNLVPKGTLLSIESVLIWLVLVGLVFLNIVNMSLLSRSFVFIPSMLIVGFAFKRITKGAATTKR